MKKVIFLITIALTSLNSVAQDDSTWKLVYHNDKDGKAIEGKIESLIEAVLLGEKIRIYWSFQSKSDPNIKVEHFTDAKFLTILSDSTVFAQIDPIIGQTPNFNSQTVQLKENLEWSFIAASNGKSDTMMRNVATGEIVGHKTVPFAIKWYIKK